MTHTTEHNAAACRASRHTRVQHLITADETSLAELEALLATLPICSTGRVFIEMPDASWQGELHVPSRMVVTWLDRAVAHRRTGHGPQLRSRAGARPRRHRVGRRDALRRTTTTRASSCWAATSARPTSSTT